MIALVERAARVYAEAWRLLPPLKAQAVITDLVVRDLGAIHGTYAPDTGVLTINTMLFWGRSASELPCIDINGNDPPCAYPLCSRGLATCLHELAHAIGAATGLDDDPAWLALSGWIETAETPPGYGRYWERRPGWEQGPSPWAYRQEGTWFPREYSTKSPPELFADAVTHVALGWTDDVGPAGSRVVQWIKRYVWEETGARHIQACRESWRPRLQAAGEAAIPDERKEGRWREAAAAALLLLLTKLGRRWARTWAQAVRQQGAWPTVATMADETFRALSPPLRRLWRQVWEQQSDDAIPAALVETQAEGAARAAVSFARTTQTRLETQVLPLLSQQPALAQAALDSVQADLLSTRVPLMVATEIHRTQQATALALAKSQGHTTATWQVTSDNPCSVCKGLDGREFGLGDGALFELGETVKGADGVTITIDYAPLEHPPLHPKCACKLEYH